MALLGRQDRSGSDGTPGLQRRSVTALLAAEGEVSIGLQTVSFLPRTLAAAAAMEGKIHVGSDFVPVPRREGINQKICMIPAKNLS